MASLPQRCINLPEIGTYAALFSSVRDTDA
jgi:hypothetical protein